MGYHTTYLGQLDGQLEITPRLNAAEVEWLRALFAAPSARCSRQDPNVVPMHPRRLAERVAMVRDGLTTSFRRHLGRT